MMVNPSLTDVARPRGVALIAVLWIVAALAISVTGISYSVRGELRQVSLSRETVQAKARAQAAMVLALQQLSAAASRPAVLAASEILYDGLPVAVQAMPLNGLIDINSAPAPLLALLFERGGGLPPQAAQELAASVVEARTMPDKQGRASRFDAIQDLLRLPGVDYELYARLAPLITAEAGGSGRVNPLAAPEAVLQVISGGNAASVAGFMARRETETAGLDTTMFEGGFVDAAPSQRLQLQVRVPLVSGARLLLTCVVDFSAGQRDSLPWRISQCGNQMEANPGTAERP